jgi:hypothetical protein
MQVKHCVNKLNIYLSSLGVRTIDNQYTSPVLEIHICRKSATQTAMNEASLRQRVVLGGMQTQRDTADRHLGPLRGAERRRLELEEDIIIIPIESIISIESSSEVKKEETEYKNVRVRTPPSVKLSCGKRCIRWCCITFCCYDCFKNQLSMKSEEIITTISNQQAERKILITIEYVHYSYIDTPSHVRVLGTNDQLEFYKGRFRTDPPLKFYLLDNNEYEQTDFDLKRMQAATLCRLVTQLKSMTPRYPDESTLQMIINKPDSLTIGDEAQETITRLAGPARITTGLELTIPIEIIQERF